MANNSNNNSNPLLASNTSNVNMSSNGVTQFGSIISTNSNNIFNFKQVSSTIHKNSSKINKNSSIIMHRNRNKYYAISEVAKQLDFLFNKSNCLTEFEFKLYLNNLYNSILLLSIYNESSSELIGKQVKVKNGKFVLSTFLKNKLHNLGPYRISVERKDMITNKIKQFL